MTAQLPAIAENRYERWITTGLEIHEARYKGGNKNSLALAITLCVISKRVLPEWVGAAFMAGHDDYCFYRIASWDDVFGANNPRTAKRLATARRNFDRTLDIWAWLDRHPARAVNDLLWDDLAKVAKVSPAHAKKLYYAMAPYQRLPTSSSHRPVSKRND